MLDPSRDPNSKPDPARRWVKVIAITALIVVLVVVIVMLASGGHQPRPH
jgi:hypothetical protein